MASRPRITAADVDPGVYFLREEDKSLWRCVGYAAEPTATLEQVYPVGTLSDQIAGHRQRRGGVVGAPIFDGFVRLVPERE